MAHKPSFKSEKSYILSNSKTFYLHNVNRDFQKASLPIKMTK